MSPKRPESAINEMLVVLLSIRNKIWNYHEVDGYNGDDKDTWKAFLMSPTIERILMERRKLQRSSSSGGEPW